MMSTTQPRIVIVEGIIGTGKTVLVGALAEHLRGTGLTVCTILEPVEKWTGVLPLFYTNPSKYALSFQSYVYVTRIQVIKEAVKKQPNADIYLLERSPFTDRVFFELFRENFHAVEIAMYEEWIHTWKDMLPIDLTTAVVIYIKPSLSVAMDRVRRRDRYGEIPTESTDGKDNKPAGGVSLEYQARLHRSHEAYLQGIHVDEFPHMPPHPITKENIIIVGPELANGDFKNDSDEKVNILNTIWGMVTHRSSDNITNP